MDHEDPDWRKYTVIVIDGASYHKRVEALRAMAALRLPILIAGPYAFDSSPCEKLFSYLKVGDLNPGEIKTGKR